MSFSCDAATRARLEWPRLVECLAACTATARGREACAGELFAPTRGTMRERLAETGEVRGLIDAGEPLPFGGIADLRAALRELERGASLGGPDAAQLAASLLAAKRLRSFLSERRNRAPRLADLAGTLPVLDTLITRIHAVVTPEGLVRDDASPELRRALRRARDSEAEIDRRMESLLRSADVQPYLQDHYVTSRHERPVLPVRADARGRVRGLVHDVSSSGTTVFIEPEDVLELGNQLRLARLEVEREVERLLRELADALREERAELVATGATLEVLDVAGARGRLSAKLGACAPELSDAGELALLALRHPLLLLEAGLPEDAVVANDVVLPPEARALVISGPNAGGKTVVAKAVGLAALALRAGLHVPCAEGSRMPVFESVWADIGDEQDLRSGLSTFSARMSNLGRIVGRADADTLVIVDEIGEGTEPGEGAALAQAVLERLVERGARVVATTHFNRLKELAGTDARFVNASAEFDAQTLLPTYRVHLGFPGSSGATWVAERMGVERAVVERAQALMDREDRKLEALTRSLSELRQELEAERAATERMREETEVARSAYEERLRKLRAAREQALAAMKEDLEAAFRAAREEIAGVVRTLQSGPGAPAPDGRAANQAHHRLVEVRERVAKVEQAHRDPAPAPGAPIDWKRVEPGSRLELAGLHGEAVLVEGPDKRGRIEVRSRGARLSLPAERVVRLIGPPTASARPLAAYVEVERGPAPDGLRPECDLRGMRVDEALDRAEAHLQSVLGTGVPSIAFIHGHGTGALRSAIRAWLRNMPGVAEFAAAPQNEGGNGVTVAVLSR